MARSLTVPVLSASVARVQAWTLLTSLWAGTGTVNPLVPGSSPNGTTIHRKFIALWHRPGDRNPLVCTVAGDFPAQPRDRMEPVRGEFRGLGEGHSGDRSGSLLRRQRFRVPVCPPLKSSAGASMTAPPASSWCNIAGWNTLKNTARDGNSTIQGCLTTTSITCYH